MNTGPGKRRAFTAALQPTYLERGLLDENAAMLNKGGLRAQLFRAIAAVVLIGVGVAIGLGLSSMGRGVETATLQDLAHQADLVAATQSTSVGLGATPRQLVQYLRRQHEIVLTNPQDLPVSARERLARGEAVQGTINFKGTRYYFAAQRANPSTLIILRPQSIHS